MFNLTESPHMTLTKPHIFAAISEQYGFTLKKSTETVGTIPEFINSTLATGDDVLISGFDKFCVKDKPERKGRNPATDQVLKIIKRHKKGVNAATLMTKTGFDLKKVRNFLNRTYKQGKIKRVAKGIYVGA